jgi:hypothetical protein
MMTVYPLILVSVAVWAFNDYMNSFLGCYDFVLNYYDFGTVQYESEFLECKEGVFEALPIAVGYSMLMIIGAHYSIQGFFFGLVVDFIGGVKMIIK